LLYNPTIDGKPAQFRPGKDEYEFWRINLQGTKNFKQAASNLLELYTNRSRDILLILNETRALFQEIVDLNRELAQSLDRAEFAAMTQYFSEVEVEGERYRGVNAGDQPWSYIIDLLFGVDLKFAFEHGIDRQYPNEILSSPEAMKYELNNHSYLKRDYLIPEDAAKLDEVITLLEEQKTNLVEMIEQKFVSDQDVLQALRDTMQTYLMTSNTHFGLARKYVPVDQTKHVQIGSSGTNIQKFLKEGLIDGRAKVVRELEARHPELHPALSIVGA
jgi:hypothetical protein